MRSRGLYYNTRAFSSTQINLFSIYIKDKNKGSNNKNLKVYLDGFNKCFKNREKEIEYHAMDFLINVKFINIKGFI